MGTVKLIFGTFNSVPAGESEYLFEEAYQNAFKPFLTAIYNHQTIKPTLFYSGPLLEWLEGRHPEFHTVLGEMTARKSIEILGGAYWEPILPMIPAADRVGQIEVMTTYLRKKFGKRSRGSWIPSQIWEAHLASSLRASGMGYVFLSERAFPAVPGFRPDYPVLAEDQGKSIIIFPVMNTLADRFLKVPPEHIVESLRALEKQDGKEVVVSLILDGVSLGGDGSYAVCYGEKWLERFFKAVEENRSWLECVHPGRYLRDFPASRPKVYVPGPSYQALMRWSRLNGSSSASARIDPSRPPAYYREFLTKYRESTLMYSKMMHVEVLANQLRGDKSRKKNAKELLWKGQEHYAYWHGPTGGIYNSRLRHAVYGALIEAEKATREKGVFQAALTDMDFDMDGEKELLYNGHIFNAYIHTTGGALFELDYLPVFRNYLATIARYPEDYHPPATREQGYDAYPRQAFMDHVFQGDPQTYLKSLKPGSRFFAERQYNIQEMVRDQARVTLCCTGSVKGSENDLQIQKTYRFRRSTLEVDYTLSNLTPRTLSFNWGSEINLALDSELSQRGFFINTDDYSGVSADERGMAESVHSWVLHDRAQNVLLQFQLSEEADLLSYPVYADYRVGRELRRHYQAGFFMPVWKAELLPLEKKAFNIVMRIGKIRSNG
ncbi:MAG: hypothetical protein CSA76_00330 [Spirochaetales bacterium]|nr:MAG: hypothetical protein CSA76_00330 [Spirochaetales bacterium]